MPALPRCEVWLSEVASRIKNTGALEGEQKVALPWGDWWTRSTCSPENQSCPGLHPNPVGSQSREGALLLCCTLVRPTQSAAHTHSSLRLNPSPTQREWKCVTCLAKDKMPGYEPPFPCWACSLLEFSKPKEVRTSIPKESSPRAGDGGRMGKRRCSLAVFTEHQGVVSSPW